MQVIVSGGRILKKCYVHLCILQFISQNRWFSGTYFGGGKMYMYLSGSSVAVGSLSLGAHAQRELTVVVLSVCVSLLLEYLRR